MFEHVQHKASEDWRQQEVNSLMQQLVHSPDNPHILIRLGRLHFAPEDQAIALHYLWQAEDCSREQNPLGKPSREALMALGELLMRRGQYADARRKYMEVLSLNTKDNEALVGKRAAEAGLDAARDARCVRQNPDAEGVLRIISPENYPPRFASHKRPDRVTGMAVVQFVCE